MNSINICLFSSAAFLGFTLALKFFSVFHIFEFFCKLKIVPWIFFNILTYVDNQLKNSIRLRICNNELKDAQRRAYYTYILVDSFKLSKLFKINQKFSLLPNEPGLEDFKLFKSAIFYIGKGTNSRKFGHFTLAKKLYLGLKVNGKNKSRLNKIVSLWKKQQGVTILQVEYDATNYEALSREYGMIECIGLDNLSNKLPSNFYGSTDQWSKMKILNYGEMLLFQLFKNFAMQPMSPILHSDIKLGTRTKKIRNKTQNICVSCKQLI